MADKTLDASKISVQLYTVRDALTADLDGTLARLAGFGFRQVEPFGPSSTATPRSASPSLILSESAHCFASLSSSRTERRSSMNGAASPACS